MFTGLIEAIGRIGEIEPRDRARRVRVETPLGRETAAGDSLAVNGVCLTAAARDATGFWADVSAETLRVTTLAQLRAGQRVNLERPLRADARLGGHFVLGHVDAVGVVAAIGPDGDGAWLEVTLPEALVPLVVHKGSIAIDGISLTVARLVDRTIGLQIVPFTLSHTSLSDVRAGDAVNLEADVLGKYVARLLAGRHDAAQPAFEPQP